MRKIKHMMLEKLWMTGGKVELKGVFLESNMFCFQKDLPKILKCQLDFIYGCKPTGQKWIKSLKKEKNVNLATEIFLVKFEGAATKKLQKKIG